jgi:ubiquinone/menaquinone biosynthesis C-methylase UbiE
VTDTAARTAHVYDLASDGYDHPALSFWERFGARTVERAAPRAGARLLDACCGTGASALPAAARVGPDGSVLGIDLSDRMLDLARAKARARGLGNVTFRRGDILSAGLPEKSFDAVICVFGVFFIEDMAAAVRALHRLVAPGGTLSLTSWGSGAFEPVDSLFWEAVRPERPELCHAFAPWERLGNDPAMRRLMADAGLPGARVEMERAEHPLREPEDGWRIVMGTGYRGTVDQLEGPARARVRETLLRGLRDLGAASIRVDVVYAQARADAA